MQSTVNMLAQCTDSVPQSQQHLQLLQQHQSVVALAQLN